MKVSDHLQILHDAGRDIQEAITVAEALESGENVQSIAVMIDALRETECTNEQLAAIVMAWAEAALKARNKRKARSRDLRGWAKLRAAVFERDGYACTYCGDTADLACDHILPVSRGGGNEMENLTTACRTCNSSKGAKTPEEWRAAFQ